MISTFCKSKILVTYHAACISSRNVIYNSTPDIEVLAWPANWIRASLVAFSSASRHVVSVQENEAHILQRTCKISRPRFMSNVACLTYSASVVGAIGWTKYEFVTVRNLRIDHGFG